MLSFGWIYAPKCPSRFSVGELVVYSARKETSFKMSRMYL